MNFLGFRRDFRLPSSMKWQFFVLRFFFVELKLVQCDIIGNVYQSRPKEIFHLLKNYVTKIKK